MRSGQACLSRVCQRRDRYGKRGARAMLDYGTGDQGEGESWGTWERLRRAEGRRQLYGDVVVAAGGAAARAGGGVTAHHHAAPHHLQPAPCNTQTNVSTPSQYHLHILYSGQVIVTLFLLSINERS